MNFKEWWAKHGQGQVDPNNNGGEDRIKKVAKQAWSTATRCAGISRAALAVLLCGLVLLAASHSVAIMEHTARLEVLEEAPETVHPDIAIDTTVPHSPLAIVRHKASLKYKTKSILEVHNDRY